jgi:probable phosphoglycerate mutase
MTLLYLVRHGETDWNRARRIQGSTDIPLNAAGRAQAATTGSLLARRQWDGIYSSPLSRAFETASIISGETQLGVPQTIDAIVERNYGTAEGMTGFEIDRMFPPGTEVPGRESRDEVADRVLPALLKLADEHPDQSLIVVSHGGVIRSILAAVDPESSREQIRNGSIHSFRHDDGELTLIAFDDPIELESLDCAEDDLGVQNAIEGREAQGRESAGVSR